MLEQSIAKAPPSRRENKTPDRTGASRIHFGKASHPWAQSRGKHSLGCFCRYQKDEAWSGSWKSSWKWHGENHWDR
jgi:hypothetical protein